MRRTHAMRRLQSSGLQSLALLVGITSMAQPAFSAPLHAGHLDNGPVRINWRVFDATDISNPRPLAENFTYLYWLEPTGEAATLYTFSLPNATVTDPLVVGLPRPITTSGIVAGTGGETHVATTASWRFGPFFDPGAGLSLMSGERTASMFVHSPSAPGDVYSMRHPIPPAICFGCELFDPILGPIDLPAPGDFDGNGQVELADYDDWATHFGQSRPVIFGVRHRYDANADGHVNAADYTLWRDKYAPTLIGSATPEPTWFALVATAFALLLTHIRHRANSTPIFHKT
jgi:hypothetical protein